MTDKELRDKAYLIATGHNLTKSFNYEVYQSTDISKYVWEQVEDWAISTLENHITGLAEDIFSNLKAVHQIQKEKDD